MATGKGKARFYLRSKDGAPLRIKGRFDDPAKGLSEVTTYSTLAGAMSAAERVGTDVAVAPYDEDRVCREIVEADRRLSAGYAEATALKRELSAAAMARQMAPFNREEGGVVTHVSVADAQARLERAQAAVAAGAMDPLVARWL